MMYNRVILMNHNDTYKRLLIGVDGNFITLYYALANLF